MPATEACVRSHQGWFLRMSKEPDDNVAQVGDVCELLAEELHAGHEVLVGGIVGTILVNGVDPIFFEDLVPNRCCGNSKAQREKAEVRRPILSEVRRQLRICNPKNTDRAIQSKVLTVFTLFSVLRMFNFLRSTTVFFPLATCSVSKYSS